MQQIMDVRLLFNTVMLVIILALLARPKGIRGRGWLISFAIVSWVPFAAFYVPALLLRLGVIATDLHRSWMMGASPWIGLVDSLSWLLLLGYVVKARAAVSEQERARYAESLDPNAEHDVIELSEHGVVAVAGTGRNITQVQAKARNLIAKPLRVVIAPGTCFTSSGSHQNMVAVGATRFSLPPHGTEEITLAAACVNAERPIPTDADGFRGVHRVPAALTRFLQAAAGASAMVRQAGVWAITDGYTADQIRRHLVVPDRDGGNRPAISESDIAEARRLLDSVGVSHRL